MEHLKEILWHNVHLIAADATIWLLAILSHLIGGAPVEVHIRDVLPVMQLITLCLASAASLFTIYKIHVEMKKIKSHEKT